MILHKLLVERLHEQNVVLGWTRMQTSLLLFVSRDFLVRQVGSASQKMGFGKCDSYYLNFGLFTTTKYILRPLVDKTRDSTPYCIDDLQPLKN